MARDNFGGDAAALEGRLKQLLKTTGESRDLVPMQVDDFIRISRIAMLCAREEVLCAVEDLTREDQISPDLNIIFAHGHALHHCVQNLLLSRTANLVGVWRCTECGSRHGRFECSPGKSTQADGLVPRPKTCTRCESQEFIYEEQLIQEFTHRIQGHPDGFLRFDDIEGLGILEVKSISPKGAWEVRGCPKIDHVIQAQCYMWLTGCRWAKILYWDKAGVGMAAFVEHTIEYDEDAMERVFEIVRSIREGIRSKKLPERICATITCARANECPVAETCFARAG